MSLDRSLAEALPASIGRQPDQPPAARTGERLPDLGRIAFDRREVVRCGRKRSGGMLGQALADRRAAAAGVSVEGPVRSRRTAQADCGARP